MERLAQWLKEPEDLQPNNKQQSCTNIRRFEDEIRGVRHARWTDTANIYTQPSYIYLGNCARNNCIGCRVLPQGLLLAQITVPQVQEIEEDGDECAIFVRISNFPSAAPLTNAIRSLVQVSIGKRTPSYEFAKFAYTATRTIENLKNPTRSTSLLHK